MASEKKDEKTAKAVPAAKKVAAKKAAPKDEGEKAAAKKPAVKKAAAKAEADKVAKKAPAKKAAAQDEAEKAPKKAPAKKAAPAAAPSAPVEVRVRVVTRPTVKPKPVTPRPDRPSLLSRPAPKPEPELPPPPPPVPGEAAVEEVVKTDGHQVFRFARPLSRIAHGPAAPKPPAPKPAPKPVVAPEPEPEPEEMEEAAASAHAAPPAPAAEVVTEPEVTEAVEGSPEAEGPQEEPAAEEAQEEEPAAEEAPETEEAPAPEAQAPGLRPNVVAPPQGPRVVAPPKPRGPRIHYGPGVKAPPPGTVQAPLAVVKIERRPPRVYDRTPSPAAMAAAAKDAAQRDLQRQTSPTPPASAHRPGGPQRPSYNEPSSDNRRKTKRERRMEKLQARQDRKERITQELADARETAQTGEAVFIREGITVKELADKLNQKVRDVIAKLMMQGVLVTINQPLDSEVAIQVANLFGYAAETISFEDEISLTQEEAPEGERVTRSPVVTVMGHVDHGKSSLLEAIHNVDITGKEFGGITQHIGAYKVRHKEKDYVFLDTPGHEAFTLMRARGAKVTDVVILVVAADDGVMPQTIEAINHCKAANVPMIVAINKMDKPGADADRVKRELSQQGVLTEDWGGDVVWCPVSAKKRQGMEELLEMVTLVSDMLNLKAAPAALCQGTVLESRLDRSRGPVASVLVQDGTLKVGDYFLCGATYGRVRGLFDDRGAKIESAGPSTPVEVLGFSEVPAVGAVFQGMEDEAKARQVAGYRKEQEKARSLRQGRVTLDTVFGQIQQGEIQELALILKADVQGSLEAVAKQISDLSTDEIKVRIVHSGVGAVSESDVLLAAASKAVIVGFNVRPDRKAAELAKSEAVDISLHTVIYDLVEQLRQALTGMLKPIEREVQLGHAEVQQIFKVTGVGTVAGCIISDGRVTRTAQVRLLRDNVIVYTGKLASLKRFKDDASEVKEGTECGIGLENYNDVKPGDVIEAFETVQEARTL